MSPTPAHLLLVDDDPDFLHLLSLRLQGEGYRVSAVGSGREALAAFKRDAHDLVVTDLCMDEMDGMSLLGELQNLAPGVPVIMLTAHGTIPDAVKATRQGVYSFLTKPIDKHQLRRDITEALAFSGRAHRDEADIILTRNAKMHELLAQARQVAQSDVNVLVQGQSGTGKELLARTIHHAASRREGPFVAINCGAVPENLLESELFGHEKGAFTGAVNRKIGLFQTAEGGTLFLDEIGDMPLSLQVKLLRVLQERQVRPLGGTRDIAIDVRIISATHRDLEKAIQEERFREDLFYRLNVVSLSLPPLEERREDIPLLAKYFLKNAVQRTGKDVSGFAPEALTTLSTASWPGNVRQLENVVERTVALTAAPLIAPVLVEQALQDKTNQLPTFAEAKQQFEQEYLAQLLQITNGNVSQAAKLAKRNRTDFYKLLAKHALDHTHFQQDTP
ncbi:sigma 54-interacting transcriptional regulator [Acanthopleuribacter pedis]|uniref:Sigma 54-interacting transcriptional regulator n=1 Tax=Acanthopleuribacter pedis TaxID=442870 RepID=A0A8J7Q8G2_9BACT|nr:sigma 54-interacting transcriptional regulator [Acanthopleuribacter pedis]MBO1319632.1 sigma 54-interacting transcriptional regulator [Acanthopleuribacter pedis]